MQRDSRVRELDGIRGTAILLVLFDHFFSYSMVTGHWTGLAAALKAVSAPAGMGVDLFFVLSGYLITGVLLDARGKQRYFRNFYARRVLRIFPLYFLFLGLVLVFYKGSEPFVLLGAIYLGNLAHIFGIAASYGVLWSLAIEEQFYAVWPWVVRRFSRSQLWKVALIVALAEPILRGICAPYVGDAQIYFYTWFRLDGLALGALLSCYVRSDSFDRRRLFPVALFGGLSCVALSAVAATSPAAEKSLYFSFTSILSLSLICATLSGEVPPLSRIMSSRALVRFGELSYFLYIAHLMILGAWDTAFGEFPVTMVRTLGRFGTLLARDASALLVCFLLAELSRRYFEGPILRLKRYFTFAEAEGNRATVPTIATAET